MEVNEDAQQLYQCKNLQGTLIDLVTSVRDDTDDHLLPAVRTPGFGTVPAAKMSNILDDPARR